MFCNLNNMSYNVSYFKNGLLCIHTFNCKLQNNFLGGISHIVWNFSKLKKKYVIRIITNSRMRDWCRELFKKLEILLLYYFYIFFTINICDKKQTLILYSNEIHSIHTRFKTNIHPPITNLRKFQKGCFLLGSLANT